MKNKLLIERREERIKIIKELSADFSISQIAQKLGVSNGLVCGIQNDPRFGIVNPRRKSPGYTKIPKMKPAEGCLDYNNMNRMF